MLFRVACQNTAAIRDAYRGLRSSAGTGEPDRKVSRVRARYVYVKCIYVYAFNSLLYIDLYPYVSQCQGERRGAGDARDEGEEGVTELQAGSPGRSPQCHPRRSRAVASRDVTRRCSDATSRQGQPTVTVAWQPLFALLPPLCSAARTPSLLPFAALSPFPVPLSSSCPTSYRSRTLYLRVHVPLLNELSPPFPFLALSFSLSLPPPLHSTLSLFSPFSAPRVATLPFAVT